MPTGLPTLRAALLAVIALGTLASVGCAKWENKMDAGRKELLAAATPCPAPATCTAKVTVAGSDVSTCSAPPAGGKYAVGDVVAIHELGVHSLARVKSLEGSEYNVTFAEGVTNKRSGATFIQVCK